MLWLVEGGRAVAFFGTSYISSGFSTLYTFRSLQYMS